MLDAIFEHFESFWSYFRLFPLGIKGDSLSSAKVWILKYTDIFNVLVPAKFCLQLWILVAVDLFWRGAQCLHFQTPSQRYRQKQILFLPQLICVLLDKAQRGNNWGKTSLRLKLFHNKECKYQILRSIKAVWFKVVRCYFPPLPWNEFSAEKDLTPQSCFTSNKSHFSWWKAVPSQLFFQPDLQLTLS